MINCPICTGEVQTNKIICDACDTVHHKDCWAENNGCSRFSCMSPFGSEDGLIPILESKEKGKTVQVTPYVQRHIRPLYDKLVVLLEDTHYDRQKATLLYQTASQNPPLTSPSHVARQLYDKLNEIKQNYRLRLKEKGLEDYVNTQEARQQILDDLVVFEKTSEKYFPTLDGLLDEPICTILDKVEPIATFFGIGFNLKKTIKWQKDICRKIKETNRNTVYWLTAISSTLLLIPDLNCIMGGYLLGGITCDSAWMSYSTENTEINNIFLKPLQKFRQHLQNNLIPKLEVIYESDINQRCENDTK